MLMFTSVTNQNTYQGPYNPSQNILRPVMKSGQIYRQSSSRIVFDPLPLQAMLLRSCYFLQSLHTRFETTSPNLNEHNCLEGMGERGVGGGRKGTVEGLSKVCLKPKTNYE